MGRKDFKLVPNVAVDDLLLDVGNARIRTGQDQRDCLERILRKEAQLVALARDIAEYGLSTASIIAQPKGGGQYVVMDGNRRVTALKLLNAPDLCPVERVKPIFKDLNKKHRKTIASQVDVLTSTSDEAIAREVLLRHSGAQGGVGQLDWSAYLRTVFLLNHKHPPDYKRPGQYVLWAEAQGIVVEEDFPISSLQRWFSKENLSLLGFDIDKVTDELRVAMPQAKHMAQIVITDFANGKKVEEVFTPELASAYVKDVRARAGIVPPPTSAPAPAGKGSASGTSKAGAAGPHSTSGGATPSGGSSSAGVGAAGPATASSKRPSRTPRRPSNERPKLFGTRAPNIGIPTTEAKASTIVAEIRLLNVKKTTLAVAMLLRHLIEISDEHYRTRFKLGDKGALAKNVNASASDMLSRGRLDKSESDATCRMASTSSKELLQIESLQKIMHRKTHHPTHQVINSFWDTLAPFVRACWAK
jgi:hypothetical protein